MKNTLFELKKAFTQLFSYPVSRVEVISADYDAYWRDKRGKSIGKLSPWQRQRAEIVLSRINKNQSISITDIGCGDGSVLKYVMDRATVSKAMGVDVSSFALEKAQEFGIETLQADIQNLNSLGDLPSSDYVLLFEILEHIHDSELFLGYIYERVEKGVFFSFPNTGFITHRLRLLFGKFPLQWRIHPREHVRFWTLADLRWWLSALGYTHYEIHTYEGVPLLNQLWPSLFAKGLLIYLPKKRSL